jgi:hypothetical protein
MPNDTTPLDTLKSEIKAEIAQALGLELHTLPPQITSQQAATVLNVKATTLSVWRSTGRHNLPFIKTGKSPFYRVADVVAFMAKHRYEHSDKVASGE